MIAADGINCFRVFRRDAVDDDVNYPVFIRDEAGALYEEPPLLHNRTELDAAIAGLSGSRLVRPMVVEMAGTPWSDGYFRKFAAFRVGDTIYAQHCAMSTSWLVKNVPEKLLVEHVDQIHAYVSTNPDADALMPIFERAEMQYGRIDYTQHEGKLLVFENNTNPTVLSDPPTRYAAYDAKPYADLHVDALLALPHAMAPPPCRRSMPPTGRRCPDCADAMNSSASRFSQEKCLDQ